MTPTPSPHPSFQERFGLGRIRRQRTANQYDASHNVTPTQAQQIQEPVSPHVDEEADEDSSDEEAEHEDGEDGHVEEEDLMQEVDGVLGDDDSDDEVEGEVEEDIIRGQIRFTNLQPINATRPPQTITVPRTPLPPRPIQAGRNADRSSWQRLLELADRQSDAVPMEIEVPFDATALGLKEIGNLASWTVSSCKPGCGVEALRDEDTNLFWQSDGPQPHHLNIHFSRLVSILSVRIFLDFESDESYTPTRITLLAGTGYHDLISFSELSFTQPKGWLDVNLEGVGGGEDGKTLRAFLVQVRVMENHQNGKDTHIRGLKVYARDERAGRGGLGLLESMGNKKRVEKEREVNGLEGGWIVEPDWMGEPELR